MIHGLTLSADTANPFFAAAGAASNSASPAGRRPFQAGIKEATND
ncbi:MAG: hypothetical protein ACRYG4_12915 [Janthinobacterium lividum]